MELPGPSTYIIFAVLLAFSAFFSASETALSSANKIRLRTQAEDGNKKAARALDLIDGYDRTLSTILVGNNVVNLYASSLATAAAIAVWGGSGSAIATIITTVLVLVFGEILPKSYAKDHSETLSLQVAGPLTVLRTILTPVVWIFIGIKRLFTGRGSDASLQPSVTEDELKTIIDTVEEEGVLSEQETDIIHSAIDFDSTTVQEILVPRVDVVAVEVEDDPREALDACLRHGFSRIPVYQDSIDNVVGVLYAKDLLAYLAKGESIVIRQVMRDAMFVYRTKKINSLLADFRRTKQHMAIVTDDYGGTLGLVTLEDVLEELVGEIFDETDEVEALPVQQLEEHLFRVAGEANIYDVFEELGVSTKNFDSDFSSAAGWALECLEHIPAPGESFDFENLHVTVEQVEDKRILSLLVRLMPPEKEQE